MKELDIFRKFLAEGQINENVSPAALARVYQGEIRSLMASGEDDVVPALKAGIEMLKQGVSPEKVNMQTAKEVARIQGEFDFDEFARIYMDKALGMMEGQLNEEKEEKVSEHKIETAIKDTLKKEGGAAGIDPLKKAVKALNVDTDFDIEKFLKKMSNVEKHKNGDYILTPLKENDEVLDEILNEE